MLKTFFSPAIVLMSRLHYSRKIALLGLLSLAAVAVVMGSLYIGLDQARHISQRQMQGAALFNPISRAVQLMQQRRGLSAGAIGGSAAMRDICLANDNEMAVVIGVVDKQLSGSTLLKDDWDGIKASWKNLQENGLGGTAGDNFAAHTQLIEQMLRFKVRAADEYNLTVGSYGVDSHYLIDTAIKSLPFSIESLGKIRGYGTGILASRRISESQKAELISLISELRSSLSSLADNLGKTGRYNSGAQSFLAAINDINNSVNTIAGLVESDILSGHFTLLPEDFYLTITMVVDRGYAQIYQTLLQETEALVRTQMQHSRSMLLASVATAFLLALVVLYFAIGAHYATVRSIQSLVRSARAFAGGVTNERIQLGARDELSPVGDSFNEMAQGFHALLTAYREDEERMHAIVNTALDAIVQMDAAGVITGWNAQAELIFGWTQSEALGRAMHETIIPLRYRDAHIRGIKRFFETGEGPVLNVRKGTILNTRIEIEALHRQGQEFPIEMAISPIQVGGQYEFNAFIRDISERKQIEESMRLASLVYENSSEGMLVTDVAGHILAVNPAFTRITGYELGEVMDKYPNVLSSGRHDESFYQAMWSEINATGRWQGEIWNRRKNGEVYPEWLNINTIFEADGSVYRLLGLFSDITQKKAAEEHIWREANYDVLTGLPNRHMFYDRLEQEIKKAHYTSLPIALIFLDLDRFKEVNEGLGHGMGDKLLKQAGSRLSGIVRVTDTVARLGGDEFALVLSELDDTGITERIAQDILQRLAEPYHLGDETAFVSASVGITLYPNDATGIDELLKNADQAMYAAKNQGGNRYSYFTSSMQEAAQSRLRLVSDLRGALAGEQFRVYYQPIVELATGAIHKAEALIRWQHPVHGLVSPAEFIPLAEETGLIIDIGDWIFAEAASQAKAWRASYHPAFQVSVNKSPVQFLNEESGHAAWLTHLQEMGLPGQGIVVEITEGLMLDGNAVITGKLLALRDAGVQVAIDDFGTGYSSLSYLKKFDIDFLKIDQSFVRNLATDSSDMALCEAIIVMAHKLGMKVIAEGVEREEQRALLVAAGCDYAQGYLFAWPMPAQEFDALLRESRRTSSGLSQSHWRSFTAAPP